MLNETFSVIFKHCVQLLHYGLQQLMMQEMKIQNKEEQNKNKEVKMEWKFKLHFTKNTLSECCSRAAENYQDRLVRSF